MDEHQASRIRWLIQVSDEPMTVLACRFGVGVETLACWKHRDLLEDRPRKLLGAALSVVTSTAAGRK